MTISPLLPAGFKGTKSRALYNDATEPFSSGLKPDQDYLLTGAHPEDAMAGETMNVWIHDGARDTGFNVHARMDKGEMRAPVTIFLPDGRILRIRTDEPAKYTDPARPHTKHIQYECTKPYRTWSIRIDDLPVWETSKDVLSHGVVNDETPTTKVSLRADLTMLSPAWILGSLLPEAYDAIANTPTGIWIAGRVQSGMSANAYRFEQTCKAEGEIVFEGKSYPFTGYGLRGHVRGTRILGGMHGHTWINAATPGGTCFGMINFTRPDGGYYFSEGFIFKNGIMYPSRINYAPVMSFDPDEGKYALEFVNDHLGLTRIVGQDKRLFWWTMPAWDTQNPAKALAKWGLEPGTPFALRHGLATYEIDGETAYGMNERSGPRR